MRLCRFSAFRETVAADKLLRSRLLMSGPLIRQLAHELNELKSPPPGMGFACPNDDGSLYLVMLVYLHGDRVTIEVDRSGCQSVTNGDIGALANGFETSVGPRLQRQLNRLTAFHRP